MAKQRLDQLVESRFGWTLTLALVAGSAFLLGSSYRPTQAENNQTTSGQTTPAVTTSPVITEIQQAVLSDNHAAPITASESASTVNINSATAEELDQLPGIGPAKAAAIISYRQEHGQFVTIDDLVNVPGIGPKTLEQFRAQITL